MPRQVPSQERRRWHGLLSNMGISFTDGIRHLGPPGLATQCMVLGSGAPITEDLLPPGDSPQKPVMGWTLPGLISIFLPEFPHRKFPGQDDFQILGFIAKGSFGPILKVKDRSKEKTYAVKVLPKSEILKHGVLEQSKEEVIIQRQVSHPFLHNLQDCWQTQRHLFIMCDYCSTGDLYTYWLLKGQFGEDEARVFAAELGCALGFLHDFGIMHRDVKFPVPPEPDHCNMLRKVRDCPYSMPKTFNPALALLLTELLCKNPAHRLRSLERFKRQTFFRGTSFDSQLLQKRPVELILELKNHPDRLAKAMRGLSMDYFQNFDCDILHSPTSPTDLSPTLANIDLSQTLATAQGLST
ncbi:unnamed protein product [Coregonus sp. 'balchen']|nr:unnamed protein product [Coregonus sp. 'balchen']